MPYPFIPVLLGTSFVLIWVFIGGMIINDGQCEARKQRELEEPLAGPHRGSRRRLRRRSQLAIDG